MAINTGVNLSKLVGYAVLAPPPGVNVIKAVGYAVLAPPPGASVIKLNAYAVLGSTNVTPPVWGTWNFQNGMVGVPYSQSWDMPTAAAVTYSVASGTLPPGLSLVALTGNAANVSGTPNTSGTYPFTLRASNANGTTNQVFSITIGSAAAGGGSYAFIC